MKKVTLLLLCFVILISCKEDDTLSTNNTWNLMNLSGGLAGVNIDYTKGEIIWTFNEQNSTLIVKINTPELLIGIDKGTYSYSIENIDGISYLNINNIEMGSFTIFQNQLIIDTNIRSGSSGSDGFLFQFEK